MRSSPDDAAPDALPPALAHDLMGELQRYRAQGGPIGPVAQRFALALGAVDGCGIAPDVVDRIAMLAQAPEPLEEAQLRWLHNQLPEIVRQLALSNPAPASSGSCPASPARSHAPPEPGWSSAGSP